MHMDTKELAVITKNTILSTISMMITAILIIMFIIGSFILYKVVGDEISDAVMDCFYLINVSSNFLCMILMFSSNQYYYISMCNCLDMRLKEIYHTKNTKVSQFSPTHTSESQRGTKEIIFEIQINNTQVSNPNEYVTQNTHELEHETTKIAKNESITHNHMNSTDQAKSCNVVNDDYDEWKCFCW
eukprot:344202_1